MEGNFLNWLQRNASKTDSVPVGIGDDAAVLRADADQDIVVATDMLCDNVHFVCSETPAEQIGRKSLAVNLSDIAAMGSRPVAAFLSFGANRKQKIDFLEQVFRGASELAAEYDVTIAGGDTNVWDGPVVVNVCVVGRIRQNGAWLRSGAQPGDAILVTGELGGSILGHHLTFEPRIREAEALRRDVDVHSCMDISDGLLLDLSRMMEASRLGAVLDFGQIPVSESAIRLARMSGRAPLDHALSDGEDFELLFTASSSDAVRLTQSPPFDKPAIHRIGTVIGEAQGLFRALPDGTLVQLQPRGFLHS